MIQTMKNFWMILGLLLLLPLAVYGVVTLLCYLRCRYAGIESVKVKRCRERFLEENDIEVDDDKNSEVNVNGSAETNNINGDEAEASVIN